MGNKKLIAVTLGLVLTLSAVADEIEGPEAFSLVFGPRIGCAWVWQTQEKFTSSVNELYSGNYFPVMTLFGVTVEQRILLGQTRSHFAFQEVLLVAGLDQGVALPEGALLIGYRDYSGFEFGIGPILHFQGISVVVALGWTLSLHGAYVPVDISYVIQNTDRPASISITTGFNFQVRRRESQVFQAAQKSQGVQKPQKNP